MNYKAKRIIKIVAAFLVGVLACGLLLHLTGTEINVPFVDKKRNEDNWIKIGSDSDYIKSQDTAKGVKVVVDDDGTIVLKGTASSSHELTVATVELDAGTYTISGCDSTDTGKFYMYVEYGSGSIAIANLDSDVNGETFSLSEAQTVTVRIYWANEYDFGDIIGTKVQPIIVSGNTAGDFYE